MHQPHKTWPYKDFFFKNLLLYLWAQKLLEKTFSSHLKSFHDFFKQFSSFLELILIFLSSYFKSFASHVKSFLSNYDVIFQVFYPSSLFLSHFPLVFISLFSSYFLVNFNQVNKIHSNGSYQLT